MSDQHLNPRETAKYWAKYTVERFIESIDKRKIGNYRPSKKSPREAAKYGKLRDSFVQEVLHNSNGDMQYIRLSFWYWGKMVDMGVAGRRSKGKGPNRYKKPRIDRRKKKWYSLVAEKEVFKLGRMMQEKYGIKSTNVILNEIPPRVNINL